MKNIQSMVDLMSFNVLYGIALFDFMMRDQDAKAYFLQKLDLIQIQDEIYMNYSLTLPIIKSGVDHLMS